jgi:hypothetical protein
MQSTHNTIGSLIAIDTKCHSYNSTYAHKGISFECALQDAFLQMQRGCITTALVGAHDEMTAAYFNLLRKAGYFGKPNQVFAGETAVAMMLSANKTEKTLCKIEAVEKTYSGNVGMNNYQPQTTDIDYIMTGINGDSETDEIYSENCAKLFPNTPLLKYKHLFGEGYTAPALGVYAAAICLKRGTIPGHLKVSGSDFHVLGKTVNKILCYNHFEGKNHTFIVLSR